MDRNQVGLRASVFLKMMIAGGGNWLLWLNMCFTFLDKLEREVINTEAFV
jgi:hypothetical protein